MPRNDGSVAMTIGVFSVADHHIAGARYDNATMRSHVANARRWFAANQYFTRAFYDHIGGADTYAHIAYNSGGKPCNQHIRYRGADYRPAYMWYNATH
jgi:hypothetical protein